MNLFTVKASYTFQLELFFLNFNCFYVENYTDLNLFSDTCKMLLVTLSHFAVTASFVWVTLEYGILSQLFYPCH